MLLFLQIAVAEPCEFSGSSDQSADASEMEGAYDDDPDSWATGSSFFLYLTLDEDSQQVEEVGVQVGSDSEFAYDLGIWYLPVDATDGLLLVEDANTMAEGEHQGSWPAGVEAEQMLYYLDVSDGGPVELQVTCEATPESGVWRGGGGLACSSEYGLTPQSTAAIAGLPLVFFVLRRRHA